MQKPLNDKKNGCFSFFLFNNSLGIRHLSSHVFSLTARHWKCCPHPWAHPRPMPTAARPYHRRSKSSWMDRAGWRAPLRGSNYVKISTHPAVWSADEALGALMSVSHVLQYVNFWKQLWTMSGSNTAICYCCFRLCNVIWWRTILVSDNWKLNHNLGTLIDLIGGSLCICPWATLERQNMSYSWNKATTKNKTYPESRFHRWLQIEVPKIDGKVMSEYSLSFHSL